MQERHYDIIWHCLATQWSTQMPFIIVSTLQAEHPLPKRSHLLPAAVWPAAAAVAADVSAVARSPAPAASTAPG